MHHRTTQAILNLRTGKGKVSSSVNYLREEASYPDQCAAIDILAKQNEKIIPYLIGNVMAKSWATLWVPPKIKKIEKSQKSINWNLAILVTYKGSIQEHINEKDQFFKAFLHGKYDVANNILASHTKRQGFTLWATYWRLALAEEMGGASARLRLRDELRNQQGDSHIAFFSDRFNFAVDRSVTEDRYLTLVKTSLEQTPLRAVLELLFLDDITFAWNTVDSLEFFDSFPIIDRYELFLQLGCLAIATSHTDAHRFIKAFSRLSESVADTKVRYTLECADESMALSKSKESELLNLAWDHYVQSEYHESIKIASEILDLAPWIFGAHEIIVKSSMYLGAKLPATEYLPCAELQNHLLAVFSKKADSEEALGGLLRYGTRCRIPTLTNSIRSLNAQHSTPSSNQKWNWVSSYSASVHGPRNFEYGYGPDKSFSYLDRCSKIFPGSLATSFFRELASGNISSESFGKIPEVRRVFFSGIFAAKHKRYRESEELLARFTYLQSVESSNALSPFGVEEARRTLMDVCRRKGDIEQLQRLVVDVFLVRPQSVKRMPVEETYILSQERKVEASRHPEFPIIAFLAVSDPHQVCICLKRFLRHTGCVRPSDLILKSELDKNVLGALFVKVCTPDVLDSIDVLDTVQKVDIERLALLEWVKNNFPQFSHLAKSEILSVTQTAELRDALETLDEAKVVLDVSGLRNAEKSKFGEAYTRYQAQRELVLSSNANAIVSAIMEIRSQSIADKFRIIPDARNHELSVFAAAFREIRDAFLSSPYYGLEACLSGQIRHGIIIQHIRNPFIEKKLAIKISAQEKKEFEQYWSNQIGSEYSSEQLTKIVDVLSRMTDQIDLIAQEVKEQWIQSKTETRNEAGLFDYSFNDDQLNALYRSFEFAGATYDTFLDYIFDVLLKRTRESLKVVRSKINSELHRRLCEIVDSAISEITAVDLSYGLHPLKHALTTCRQELETIVCAQMHRWFQESKTALMGDTDFTLIAKTAVGMVERLNPNFRNRFTSEVDSEFKVRGRHFRAVVLMIFFLLDNAVQHSKVPSEDFEAFIRITAKGNRLSICVTAKMNSLENAKMATETIKERVEQHRRELVPEQVIREGGSGLAKVIATVVYEFDQKNPNIEASYQDSSLSVTVVAEMEGIAV